MATSSTSNVYIQVIEDVVSKMRQEFIANGGPGEGVLSTLQGSTSFVPIGCAPDPLESMASSFGTLLKSKSYFVQSFGSPFSLLLSTIGSDGLNVPLRTLDWKWAAIETKMGKLTINNHPERLDGSVSFFDGLQNCCYQNLKWALPSAQTDYPHLDFFLAQHQLLFNLH
ncbi:transcription factor IIA, alpha/beta subunit [Tanacetum coccineum]